MPIKKDQVIKLFHNFIEHGFAALKKWDFLYYQFSRKENISTTSQEKIKPVSKAAKWEKVRNLSKSRVKEGIINKLTPFKWRKYAWKKNIQKSVGIISPVIEGFERPIILLVGAGEGGLLQSMWREPEIIKIGIEINYEVLITEGIKYYIPVQGSASHLPIKGNSVDVVFFEYVLHHLVGQGSLERAIREGARVLKKQGYMICCEPSAYSPLGLALNVANTFRLMNFLTGSSDYEFAISPGKLKRLFQEKSDSVEIYGLTYAWSRFPIFLQELIRKYEKSLIKGKFTKLFSEFLVYIAKKIAA